MKVLANIFSKKKNERIRGIMQRTGALLFALCLTAAVPMTALAETAPVEIDPERTDCSITLELNYTKTGEGKKDMEGGSIGIFTVAAVKTDGGVQTFDTSAGKFAGSSAVKDIAAMDENTLNKRNSSIAAALVSAATADKADKTEAVSKGEVSFTGLKPGLYLVRQIEKSNNDVAINPFLISIPYENEFQVAAKPKAGITVPQKPKTPEKSKKTPKKTTTRTTKGSGRIPQTGQLWWPVFAGASLGLVLIVSGIVIRRKSMIS